MAGFSHIRDLLENPPGEEEVQVRGWVYRTRSSGKIVFAVLRDSTGIVQVTIKKGNLPDPEFEQAVGATIESSVEVRGTVHKDDRAPGGHELRAKRLPPHRACPAISHHRISERGAVA